MQYTGKNNFISG